MSTSKLDAVYRSFLITKFFTKGWGKPENLRRLFEFRKIVSKRDECFKLVERDYPVTITKDQKLSDCRLVEGFFITPLERYLPGIVPEIALKAHFQALFPLHWPQPDCKPVCLHLAGTGDHFFWRRRNLMVKPLLKNASIGGIILENPFYGLRKPTDQIRSSLHNVSDIFVMGGCLILESLVLFHWCERNGFGPLGVTGLSMGGHMASLAATNWPKPLVLVPCLSWSTASAVFLQGVMAHSINWDLLEDQYLSDGVYREKLSKMVTVVDEAFLAGKKFARTFTEKVEKTELIKPNLDTSKTNTSEIVKDKHSSDLNNNVHQKLELSTLPVTEAIKKRETFEPTKVKLNSSSYQSGKSGYELDKLKSKESARREVEAQVDAYVQNMNAELKKLLDKNKINESLYIKLTSNDKFELDIQDIEVINKLTEEQLKDYVLKCKISDIQSPLTKKTETVSARETLLSEIANRALLQPEKQQSLVVEVKEKSKIIKKSWSISEITSDWFTNLPFTKSKSGKKIDISKIHWRDREALQFMRGIMDECTHLSNFSVPFDTSLIIAVCAKHDAYVPRDDTGRLEEIWPGAEVRYVDAGHVSAYILHQSLFRSCIIEAFERSKKRWKDGKHVD